MYPFALGYLFKIASSHLVSFFPSSTFTMIKWFDSLSKNSYIRLWGNNFKSIFGCSYFCKGVAKMENHLFQLVGFSPNELSCIPTSLSSLLLAREASNLSVGDGSDEYSLMHSSMMSTNKKESLMDGFFMNFDQRNYIFSSLTSKTSFLLLTSIIALAVAKKGIPRGQEYEHVHLCP